nr:Chain A, Cannabinoid receptor 1 [synthetic construct]
DIRALKTLV